MSRKEREKTTKSGKFQTKKSLGQHFLNNSRVPALMADAGNVKKGDIVLEIGPGTGALTRELLSRGATVLALEADLRAIDVLRETFKAEIASKHLILIHGDARKFGETPELHRVTLCNSLTLSNLSGGLKVVANIPYYLSGFLFRTLLESDVQPTDIVFLVQREVAERIARDKKESLLSLSVKVYGDPHYIKTVARGNFTPPPKVDSAIIAIQSISKERLGDVPEDAFFELIHAGFASKRKQLLGNLSTLFPRETLVHIFSTLGIRKDVRGEDLRLNEWLGLAHALFVHK
jgi:16S rRNA (adenine1518-N6/adenine1519-N6)-dimethyltransferase